MPKDKQNSLYRQTVEVSAEYLGPTAERFIARHIQTHLNKSPEDLTQDDLDKLIDWLRLSIALLTADRKIVEDFTESLRKLIRPSGKP